MIIGLDYWTWQSCLQNCGTGVPSTANIYANISSIASVPGDVAELNNPGASAVAVNSDVADVISVVRIDRPPGVVMGLSVPCSSCCS
jgi:hypothetical protein